MGVGRVKFPLSLESIALRSSSLALIRRLKIRVSCLQLNTTMTHKRQAASGQQKGAGGRLMMMSSGSRTVTPSGGRVLSYKGCGVTLSTNIQTACVHYVHGMVKC
jgi:hypothetical protein